MARRTLITVAVALTVVAFFAAEADFWDDDLRIGSYDTYTSTLFTSFRVAHRGEIELDESQSRIVRMSPGAVLDVAERRFLTRRRLRVEAAADGRPEYELEVGSRQRSEEDALEFLADVMPQIVRSTTIGARPLSAQWDRWVERGHAHSGFSPPTASTHCCWRLRRSPATPPAGSTSRWLSALRSSPWNRPSGWCARRAGR